MASRMSQVLKCGWQHSGEMASSHNENQTTRLRIFFDIMRCFHKYKMWSNQYLKEDFYYKDSNERQEIGKKYLESGLVRDAWQKDFRETRKFLIKFSGIKYEKSGLREKRNQAYASRFNAGSGLMVEYDVNISRQHYLNGSIKIGNNVLLAKNVFIDYSGKVEIKDNVQLTNGVIIETHYHPFHSDWKEPRRNVCATELVIEEGAVVGSRAIIMPTCHYIGKNARVGAGAVVTHDVPDFSIVVGVPAKVVRTMEHEIVVE